MLQTTLCSHVMFQQYKSNQFAAYNKAVEYFVQNSDRLIGLEKFIMQEILHFIDLNLPDIESDYNEASYLHSFWKNYPPLDRGRSPVGDQYPWIEVGEQVFGNKLSRYFAQNFHIKDTSIPSGSDDRLIISSERIKRILGITDSVWVFIDIKSAGPRDDFDNAVMSPYQVSGSGDWKSLNDGITNKPIKAIGQRSAHDFICSLSPIYVLSDNTIAPLVSFVIKPTYRMEHDERGLWMGQPLHKISVAAIPNGLLLTKSPNYLTTHPELFIPGKDDRHKNPLKRRARISFTILQEIDEWRVREITV